MQGLQSILSLFRVRKKNMNNTAFLKFFCSCYIATGFGHKFSQHNIWLWLFRSPFCMPSYFSGKRAI